MSEGDRRAPGATRIPFEAMVEVGGATGPAFEAQAVDVSLEGMHLKTAYLPEVGQPLTCRFDAGPREMVLASGEVVWSREAARGGEFGIRFSNLDSDSARILGRMTCTDEAPHDGGSPRAGAGMKVRLHIEGLGSPMRARVKGVNQAELTVGSELGFLQVGKGLELENAETGKKRAAVIDRVEVQVDPGSQVPELVVALRYADDFAPLETAKTVRGVGPVRQDATERMEARAPIPSRPRIDEVHVESPHDAMDTTDPEPMHASAQANEGVDVEVADTEHDAADEGATRTAADRMKGAFSRSAAKVTPAINAFAQRAKTTFALLAARKWRDQRDGREGREGKDDVGIPMRRVTAPPPGGGLHAEGRKVVRDFSAMRDGLGEKPAAFTLDKKKMIIGGVAGTLLILGAVAMRKPATPPPAADTAASEAPMASAAPADSAAANAAPNAANALAAAPPPTPAPAPAPAGSDAFTDVTPQREEHRAAAPRRIVVAPFSNGAVSHGNVLRLKMDGAIEKIQGAAQPTGFTVVVPSRRSLEAAAPLAARDGRIASIKVVNDSGGAELSVTFKDGVPNYLVRAKGETLEIVLAPVGKMNDRQQLADAQDGHEGTRHEGARAHATPNATGKRKHPAAKKH